jgi:hypothetical protein
MRLTWAIAPICGFALRLKHLTSGPSPTSLVPLGEKELDA